MPPETFTWDRKEFYRDRNHERSSEPRHYSHPQSHFHPYPHRGGGGGGGYGGRINGGGPRWREHNFFPNSHHHPYPQTNDHHPSPRWGSDARCRQGPSGYGKQGGRHFHEEEGRGFGSSRSRDKSLVDETFRVSAPRKFIRYDRENKSFFGQKEWKGHYTDAAPSTNGPGIPNGMTDRPKLVDDVLPSNASFPRADLAELPDQSQLKKQHEKNDSGTLNGITDRARLVNDVLTSNASYPRADFAELPDQSQLKKQHEGTLNGITDRARLVDDLLTSNASYPRADLAELPDQSQLKKQHEKNGTCIPNGMTDRPRLVDDVLTANASCPHADLAELHDQSQLKMQPERNNTVMTTVGVSQKPEGEASIGAVDWKSIRGSRPVIFSSCGSAISYTNSTRDMEMDSINSKDEVQQTDVSSIQSPSCDVANPIEVPPAACESLASPSEDTSSRKKPRLRWGEGLAKFEKKKVEGVDDCVTSNGPVVYSSSSEQLLVDSTKSADESPTVNASSDIATPVTSNAVGYSCSPGIEEKQSAKADVFDHDAANLSSSTAVVSQNNVEGLTFNLEILDQDSIACLDSAIDKLLQSDCQSSGDSGFVRSTAMNKLLVWKGDMLKALEVTESEIDKFEVQLKSMLEPEDSHTKPSLNIVIDGDSDVYQKPKSEVSQQVNTNCEDVESPGSTTSKLVEGFFSKKNVSSKQEDCVQSSSKQVIIAATVLDAKRSIESVNSRVKCDGYMDKLHGSIWASNRDTANGVAEEFNKLLPSKQTSFDIHSGTRVRCVESTEIIKANLLRRKRFQQFNERVLALKFRVLQHFWNQDVRLLSMKKNRVKSQKKLDHRLHALQNGNRKYHLSIHSRLSSSPGKLSLTPDVEIIKYVGKLISESKVKPLRKELKMPALTLDKKENMWTRFVSKNGLVEDPGAVEKDRSMTNFWTEEEREIFLDKFSEYGKDFTKIASFITHKTTADCIEFYYKNHKSDSFKKATKKYPDLAKQGKFYPTNNYLVTSGKRLIFESNDAASLDILGEASAMAANAEDCGEIPPKCASRFTLGTSSNNSRGSSYLLERSTSLDAYENERERETVAADVLAGICSSLSSEAMGSCITSAAVDPAEGYQEHTKKRKRACSSRWRHWEPEVTDVDETCSDDSCGEKKDLTDWTDEEKSIFVQSVSSSGKDFAMISRFVRTRSRDQCKTFFSKARKCLSLDVICPGSSLVKSGFNISGNDASNVCVEADSCISDEKPTLNMEVDLPSSGVKLNSELESEHLSNLDSVNTECNSRNPINDSQMEKLDQVVDGDNNIDQKHKPVAINYEGTSEISSSIEVPGNLCGIPDTQAVNKPLATDVTGRQGHTSEKDGTCLGDTTLSVNDIAKSKLYVNDDVDTQAVDIPSSNCDAVPGNLQKVVLESDSSEKPCVITLRQSNYPVPMISVPQLPVASEEGTSKEATAISVDPSRPKEWYLSRCSLAHNVEHQIDEGYAAPDTSSVEQMGNNCSQLDSSLGMEKTRQSVKVKLFGQILSKSPNQKSSSPMIQQNGEVRNPNGSTFHAKESGLQ